MSSASMTIRTPLKDDLLGQKELLLILDMLIGGANSFGKTSDRNLAATNKLFLFALGDYYVGDLISAIKEYVLIGKGGVPEPKDIHNIIKHKIVSHDSHEEVLICERESGLPEFIKDGFSTLEFSNWISKLSIYKETECEVILVCKGRFLREYVIQNYKEKLCLLWKKNISIVIEDN
jgi:hypothetical protein